MMGVLDVDQFLQCSVKSVGDKKTKNKKKKRDSVFTYR